VIAVLTPMKAELRRVKELFSGLEGAYEISRPYGRRGSEARRGEDGKGESGKRAQRLLFAECLWHGKIPVASLMPTEPAFGLASAASTASTVSRASTSSTAPAGGRGEVELFLGLSGVGKTVSALAVQEICVGLSPELLLFGGLAGGIAPGLDLESLIIADEVQQWDMDATSVGLRLGEVPFLAKPPSSEKRGVLRLDPGLCSQASSIAETLGDSRAGKIATGDSFLGGKDREKKEWIRDKTGAIAVDMEGWSAVYAAAVHGVPALLVRVVSDTLEGKRRWNLRRSIDGASKLLARLFLELLRQRVCSQKVHRP